MGEQQGMAVLPRVGWLLGLAGVLVLGAVLRLLWVGDIEYKADEVWTFQRVQEVQAGQPLPMLGMPSSQGPLNPGLSLWIFVGLGRLADVHDPRDLARAVQILNIAAILGLVILAWRVVPAGEREAWLWAAALVAVNPLAVLFQRKIWPPCVFPPLITIFLLCWWYRDRRWAACGWGLVGACLGQIHIPGFFFAAGFVLWAFLFDRKRPAWGSFFLGSLVGALPLLPWLYYLFTAARFRPHDPAVWTHIFEGKFWLRWVLEPLGFGLDYSLGRDFLDFLRQPLLGGRPTFGMLILHILAGGLGLVVLVRAGRRWRRERGASQDSPTAFTQNAALWGYGLLLTLSAFHVQRHYMIVLFPLQFLWLARLALGPARIPGAPPTSPKRQRGEEAHHALALGACGRLPESVAKPLVSGAAYRGGQLRSGEERAKAGQPAGLGRGLLAGLVVVQSLISLQFLAYVHDRQRIQGDYGPTYAVQHLPADGQAGDMEEAELYEDGNE
jgi:hypothetical protein